MRSAKTALGYITRNAINFNHLRVLKVLYFANVRSNMEYLTIIWKPYFDVDIMRIERVQNAFLRFAARQTGTYYDFYSHDYTELWKMFAIPKMEVRFLYIDLMFLYKIINGFIYCPEILSRIDFFVPTRQLRSSPLFRVNTTSSEFAENCLYARIFREANSVSNRLDFFSHSIERFSAELRALLYSNNNLSD